MASTLDLLTQLTKHRVEFVLVGGMASIAHGSSMVTRDVDVCAPLTLENVEKILAALRSLNPRWRMLPNRPPVPDDAAKLAGFKNLYIQTDLGQLDVLGEITGVGEYADVARNAIELDLGPIRCGVMNIDALIESKRALGRPRDLQAVRELEAIRQKTRPGSALDAGCPVAPAAGVTNPDATA